ncbi:MAG: formylglycine-generating enzyme family protein [Bacteroidia bacterium]
MTISLTEYEKNLPHHEMIFVEGGEFYMGGNDVDAHDSEKPVHKVRLTSFYMGKYPVTQALWHTVMETNPSDFKEENHPVEQVSWNDTQTFLQNLNKKARKIYRLPTEAEWEFAARGGIYSQGYLYAGSDKLKDVGWYRENSENKTHPVGQKLSNELSLFDMSGNVWEWCSDWYSREYYQKCAERDVVENPIGSYSGVYRVRRGGCCLSHPQICRIGFRNYTSPGIHDDSLGFRLALSISSNEN